MPATPRIFINKLIPLLGEIKNEINNNDEYASLQFDAQFIECLIKQLSNLNEPNFSDIGEILNEEHDKNNRNLAHYMSLEKDHVTRSQITQNQKQLGLNQETFWRSRDSYGKTPIEYIKQNNKLIVSAAPKFNYYSSDNIDDNIIITKLPDSTKDKLHLRVTFPPPPPTYDMMEQIQWINSLEEAAMKKLDSMKGDLLQEQQASNINTHSNNNTPLSKFKPVSSLPCNNHYNNNVANIILSEEIGSSVHIPNDNNKVVPTLSVEQVSSIHIPSSNNIRNSITGPEELSHFHGYEINMSGLYNIIIKANLFTHIIDTLTSGVRHYFFPTKDNAGALLFKGIYTIAIYEGNYMYVTAMNMFSLLEQTYNEDYTAASISAANTIGFVTFSSLSYKNQATVLMINTAFTAYKVAKDIFLLKEDIQDLYAIDQGKQDVAGEAYAESSSWHDEI